MHFPGRIWQSTFRKNKKEKGMEEGKGKKLNKILLKTSDTKLTITFRL
jgi:hypothetical protein